MSVLYDAVSQYIKEEIAPGVEAMLPEYDSVFGYIKRTSQGVSRGLGRDTSNNQWVFKKTFRTGIGGAYGFRQMGSTTMLTGSPGSGAAQSFRAQDLKTWQTLASSPFPGTTQRTVGLKEGFGNFFIPLDVLRTDEFDSSVGEYVDAIVQGAAERVVCGQIAAFWALGFSSGNYGKIATGTSPSSNEDPAPTGTMGTWTLTAGRISSLRPGMTFDLYSDDGSDGINTRQTTDANPVWIESYNPLAKTFSLRAPVSINISASTKYHLVPHRVGTNAAYYGPSGLESWISTGTGSDPTSVFGLSLTNFPQLRSLKVTSAAALSDSVLNSVVGALAEAKGGKVTVDTIITTTGVLLGYVDNVENLGRYQRNDMTLKPAAGFSPFSYTYNGKEFGFMTSIGCPSGVAYITKLGGANIKKYVPPRLPKAGSMGEFTEDIEFVVPALTGGANGPMWPVTLADTSTGEVSLTNFLQVPFLNPYEFAPDDFVSGKISSITEVISSA